MRATALRAFFRHALRDDDFAALFARIGRNAMAPPQLAADAPVADVLHPVAVRLHPTLRIEFDAAVVHRLQGGLRQRLHLHEPLVRKTRLDGNVVPFGITDLMRVVFDMVQQAKLFDLLHDGFAADIAVHAFELLAGLRVHRAVVVHDVDDFQIVAQTDFIVVRVMRRRDLHGARAEVLFDVIVCDQLDFAIDDRQDQLLADLARVAFIRRIDRDGRIAHQRLRTCRGDDDVAAAVRIRIAEMPQMAFLFLVDDLFVREGRAAFRAPVDDAVAFVDQTLVVQADEAFLDGGGKAFVHRETLALPVAGRSEGAQLLDDLAAVLLLPGPDAFQKLLASKIIARKPFVLLQFLLDLRLRRDAGVVRSGQPAGFAAVQLLEADENVLQRVVQDVAHRQLARDVRRRNDDRVRLLGRIHVRMEIAALFPYLVPLGFHFCGIVGFRQFFCAHGFFYLYL